VFSIVAGLVLGVMFVRRQGVLADPLIDLRLFQVPAFSASLATYTLATFVAFGAYLFTSQYLQLVLGLSPFLSGLWMLPFFVGFILGSMACPVLARRAGPGPVMSAGLVVAAIGYGLLARVDGAFSYTILVAFFIFSLGLAPAFTLTTDLIVGSAPPERAGAASALSETGSEFGGALGIAILGSIGTAVYRRQVTQALPEGIPGDVAEAARSTLGGAVAAAGQLPERLGASVIDAAREAFTHGMRVSATISMVTALGLAVFTAVLLRGMQRSEEVN
jgi:DHA2 family multidrug resistance protein-like MFS transporter